MTLGHHLSTGLLWLAAALPNWTISCKWTMLQEDRVVNSYTIAVRCRTPDGEPVANVLVVNPESGASGFTDWQGKIGFRIDGYEGTEVSFRVDRMPSGILQADDSAAHRVILKAIAGPAGQADEKSGLLTYDIPMRKARETYVVLVSTKGVPDLPVLANGVTVGKLNSRGAGAFRLQGQPGEELKLVIQTGDHRAQYSLENPEKTFTLPQISGILSFGSSLAQRLGPPDEIAAKPVVTFVPQKKKRSRSKKASSSPAQAAPTGPSAPVQIPFRGIEVK